MKYFSVLAAAALCILAFSCSKYSDRTPCMVPVSVHVSNFSITQEAFPSKTTEDPSSYSGIGAITLAFFSGDTEVYKATQIKSDASTYTVFGDFSCSLPIGNYTLVAVSYTYNANDVFTLTSPTAAAFTSERPRETFCKTQTVTVTNTTPLDLSITLERIVAKLVIISTDGRPASVTKIRTTYSKGGKSFNPTTGLATSDTGFSLTNSPSSAVGATINVGSFPFLASDEETMDITIEGLDANENVLATKMVSNVPLRRNRVTTLSGALFTAGTSTSSFQLETSWLDGNTVTF